jgi:hypothetical protein
MCNFSPIKEVGTMTMRYKIALEKSEEGYSISFPALPGCWSQGESEQEAIENIKIAIHEGGFHDRSSGETHCIVERDSLSYRPQK